MALTVLLCAAPLAHTAGTTSTDAPAATPTAPVAGGDTAATPKPLPPGAQPVGSGIDPDVPLAVYPTTVIADYVLGCMSANGNTYNSLQQCSCSIDLIRSRMDYATYERVSTVMELQLDRGQRGIFYRDSNWAKQNIENMQDLQAESTLRCF